MAKSYVSENQSIFVFGIDPTQRIAMDSTKELTAAAECVAGYPLVLVAATGKLNTTSAATGNDVFYGISSSNINTLYGRVSLENWTAARANAEMLGRYTIRPSVFLDSTQNEKTAYPFCAANGTAATISTSDVGKQVHAILLTVNDANDAFNGTTMMKLTVGTKSTECGCENIGQVVAVRGTAGNKVEVEIWLKDSVGTPFSN